MNTLLTTRLDPVLDKRRQEQVKFRTTLARALVIAKHFSLDAVRVPDVVERRKKSPRPPKRTEGFLVREA